jgi:hypothetical protein
MKVIEVAIERICDCTKIMQSAFDAGNEELGKKCDIEQREKKADLARLIKYACRKHCTCWEDGAYTLPDPCPACRVWHELDSLHPAFPPEE